MRDIALMGIIVSLLSACTHTGLKKASPKIDKQHVVSTAIVEAQKVQERKGLAFGSRKKHTYQRESALTSKHHFTQKQQHNQQHKYTILYSEEGNASYYSSILHGRKTASGEVYDQNNLTAAHKKLPFGTRIRVLNQDNGRSVWVTINDRGPFAEGRILDLSYQAAEQLDMLKKGRAHVKIDVIQ